MNKSDHRSCSAFQELHYCSLDSQCTVYTLTNFYMPHIGNTLLVAPHSGNIMCVGFQNVLPLSKCMSFTCIPAEAEIMAIDSLNKGPDDPVIGVIFVKVSRQRRESSGKSLTSYFNIYSEFGVNHDNSLSKNCNTLELCFLPYQLYHTDIYSEDSTTPLDTVFLISGGDEKIHLYMTISEGDDEDNDDDDDDEEKYHECSSSYFAEVDVEKYFKEFVSLPGIVTSMQCLNLPSIGKRLSIVGCKEGRVSVYLVDLFQNEVQKSCTYEQDSLITSVQIFTIHPYDAENPPKISEFHVLITSAFEEALVARGVFESGFNSLTFLKGSDSFDCITCSLVGDVDFDGEMEIILGSYGQKLLFYKLGGQEETRAKFHPNAFNEVQSKSDIGKKQLRVSSAAQLQSLLLSSGLDNRHPYSTSSVVSLPAFMLDGFTSNSEDKANVPAIQNLPRKNSNDDSVFELSSNEKRDANHNKSFEFNLLSSQDFHDPIMGLDLVDLTSDSLKELVVMTMNGVHILQKDADFMLNIFEEKLKFSERNVWRDVGTANITADTSIDYATSEDDISEKSFISKYE